MIMRWVISGPNHHIRFQLCPDIFQGLVYCDQRDITVHVWSAELPCLDLSSTTSWIISAAIALTTISDGSLNIPWICMKVWNMNDLESFSPCWILRNLLIKLVYKVITLKEPRFRWYYLLCSTVCINLGICSAVIAKSKQFVTNVSWSEDQFFQTIHRLRSQPIIISQNQAVRFLPRHIWEQLVREHIGYCPAHFASLLFERDSLDWGIFLLELV